MKLKILSFVNALPNLKKIYKKNIEFLFYNRLNPMSVKDNQVELSNDMLIDQKMVGVKRAHEKDDDEKWVKRIQLTPDFKETSDDARTTFRRKLRKFVLLLSYCGKGYLGMQRNPGYRTIEDDLLVAMLKADLIKEEGVTCPQIYRFQRAARTDKGVSAVRQIVSIKLPDDVDIPEVINVHLPEQIRVMKAVRVTQKFDAKTQCDSRSYSYLCPTFAFAPSEITNESYRISEDILQELRSIFNTYKGTHNYHNFTAKVKYQDRSAQRYIMDFTCSVPFVREGIEWTLIKVKGQSFMLHQIRKMVGLAISICKGYISKEIFSTIWKQDRHDVPIAPSLGLVLEEPHYLYYNKKYNDGIHEQLLWDAEEEQIQTFREKFIDSIIVKTELKEKSMLTWLETLEYHTFDIRTDGPPGEKIPYDKEKNETSDLDSTEQENSNCETEGKVASAENGETEGKVAGAGSEETEGKVASAENGETEEKVAGAGSEETEGKSTCAESGETKGKVVNNVKGSESNGSSNQVS